MKQKPCIAKVIRFRDSGKISVIAVATYARTELQNLVSGEREFNNEVLEFRTFISFAFSAECPHEEK